MISITAYLIALAVSLPLVVLASECFLALLPRRKSVLGERVRCAVVIPAHDEQDMLAATLNNLKGQLAAGDRVIVVADNCSDRTAEIARDRGVEVLARDDPQRRGKGFALDAGMAYLKDTVSDGREAPEVVVILDADCVFTPGSLDRLVRATAGGERPQQAQNLMHALPSSRASIRLSAFAFLTKNLVRPRGLDRVGLCVQLTGSGMAFPWTLIKELELGTPDIVEDLELGLQMVIEGRGPRFCEEARVDSYFPESDKAASKQRRRWEHGRLGQMRRQLPVLFQEGIKGNGQAFASFFDMIVPPLTLLVFISGAAGTMLIFFYWLNGDTIPISIFLSACSFASIGLASIWMRFGRETVSVSDIIAIPVYAGRKIPMYLAVPFRAERESESN